MVYILAHHLDQVLVDGYTAGFQCFTGNLLLFITDKMGNKGEQINWSLFESKIWILESGI